MSAEPGWLREPREQARSYFAHIKETERRLATGITVAHAAEQAGISEEAMRDALTGMARLAVVNGDLVVAKDDLNSLAHRGAIPRPSAVRAADADPFAADPDPELDRRVAAAAEEIGLDMETGPATEAETPETSEPDPGPFSSEPDPQVEARTAAMAQQLGLDVGTVERKQPPPGSDGAQRITAEDRPRRRLGGPRRWSGLG